MITKILLFSVFTNMNTKIFVLQSNTNTKIFCWTNRENEHFFARQHEHEENFVILSWTKFLAKYSLGTTVLNTNAWRTKTLRIRTKSIAYHPWNARESSCPRERQFDSQSAVKQAVPLAKRSPFQIWIFN